MSRILSFPLLLAILVMHHWTLLAQSIPPSGYHIRHYTDADGLPQNSIKSIARDPDGFIWLATEDGLSRFDGRRLVHFSAGRIGITSGRFFSFFKKKASDDIHIKNHHGEEVYIRQGRPFRYDGPKQQQNYVEVLELGPVGKRGGFEVYGLPYQPRLDGNIISTLYLFTRTNVRFTITDDTVTGYRNNECWFRTPFRSGTKKQFFLLNHHLYYLAEDGQLFTFQGGARKVVLEGDLANGSKAFTGKPVVVYWNGTVDNGRLFFHDRAWYHIQENAKGNLQATKIFENVEIPPMDIDVAYYEPGMRQLYLGSQKKGLFVLTAHNFRTFLTGIKKDVFYGVAAYQGTDVLTAGGIQLKNGSSISIAEEIHRRTPANWYNIYVDANNNSWVSWLQNLYQFRGTDLSLERQWRLPDEIGVVSGDQFGTIWLGPKKIRSIYTIDPERPEAGPRPAFDFPEPVTCFNRTSADRLYIGTDSGLYRMHLRTKRIDTVPGFKGVYVRSLYAPTPHELWITTYGHGFLLLKQDSLIRFPPDREGRLLTAHCIVEDRQGFFWITTNKGLFKVRRSDLLAVAAGEPIHPYYELHDKTKGMVTNEFNGGCQSCGVQLQNGSIVFPSLEGLVWFQPDSMARQTVAAQLFIDRIQLDGREIAPDSLAHLQPGDHQLLVSVSTPYFGHQDNLTLEYALQKGTAPRQWIKVQDNGDIHLTGLSSGEYTLHIRNQCGFEKSNMAEIMLPLYLLPYWYETTAAKIALATLLLLIAWGLMWWRIRRIRKRNRLLEVKIEEGTAAIRKQTDMQRRIIQVIGHDLRTPLKYQLMLTAELNKRWQEKNETGIGYMAATLHEHTDRLCTMTDNLLEYMRSQVGEGTFGTHQLSLLVEEKDQLFKGTALHKETRWLITLADGCTVWTDARMCSVIIHNILDNALKVTKKGVIRIYTEEIDNHIHLIIEDSGPGLKAGIRDWLNGVAPAAQTQGLGLTIVKELAELLRIGIRVRSAPGQGTVFRLIFPHRKDATASS